MPHFRFRAIAPEYVQQLSQPLVDELHTLMESPEGDFTIEHIPASFFFAGQPSDAYPFVEVLYFDRGQAVQDEIARVITRLVREANGQPEQDVAVIFTHLQPVNYYDNGEHY
ncbi:DUF1904 domain-containing protein [Parendozoicomonas haliclonae]|uniref:Tautomerase enzyme n=1 Tax=Parendozoicomonas haliclonae TaxID=1960125 RepID=A0A1X7AKF9_9GAMM|nr:DUF1904 domain-containing protein [Parendozoicomonas haliclonae]SMA47041.1 hypothetical protein EHSB41UT_02290 [Parendozoicomonas haliclonae]